MLYELEKEKEEVASKGKLLKNLQKKVEVFGTEKRTKIIKDLAKLGANWQQILLN